VDSMYVPRADEGHVLVRLPVVVKATGLSRATLYRLARTGAFPRPRKLGERASAWIWGDIVAWINSRPLSNNTPGISSPARSLTNT
jgi:prophage regulatory protein